MYIYINIIYIIFKLKYNTGIIPQEWKSANIVPIYKKGDKNLISNYRPISLLCLSAKIMERVVQDELLNLTRHLLNPAQHGFLSGKSCTTNLITLTDDIANNLFNDIGTDIIYFDFAKAFDTANHDLLLSKLNTNFKIDGRLLKFIASYLRNRHQRVVLELLYNTRFSAHLLNPKIIQKSIHNKTQTPQYQPLNPKLHQIHPIHQKTTSKPKNNTIF